MYKIFIDGSAGTTGLRINERLAERKDIFFIKLDDNLRKDINARKIALNEADIVFLCLPDAAAIEAVSLIENNNTVIIDTSTAHRVNDGWTYGFPEINKYREKIKGSKRIANPGCHASGFVSLIAPLTECGALKKNLKLSCFSLTGYSGGGKSMIAQYHDRQRDFQLDSPGQYGLNQNHKHLPEMKKICTLDNDPIFCPIVAPYYSGMEVTVPLFASDLNASKNELIEIYKSYYTTGLVSYVDETDSKFLYSNTLSGKDNMEITVCGNNDRILLISRFDNLGKGASGSAIQNMNIVMGLNEAEGLNI